MTRVKVCGVRRLEDAMLAVELGASAIGFVFWPGSPRFIDPHRARAIAAALPPGVTPVGVFVDQPVEFVASVAGLVSLGGVQLHGFEAVGDYARVRPHLIKAIAVSNGFDPESACGLPAHVTVMLDAHDPVRRGGTGRTIDWSVAATVAAKRRTILSGGLHPDNVVEAVSRVRPYMIDVSSGVESAPGVKDPEALRAFFAAVASTDDGRQP